ncbi:MAG: YjbQ family protein [Candidatus Omnitrophica bacterium]|nr:YjbQ family protein [Candidatus Omnitrophota bacterium]
MLKNLQINTNSRTQLLDITSLVQKEVEKSKVQEGLCILHVPHTTAGITINENADPSVRKDIINELSRLIPLNSRFSHSEGNSDAHIKASMMGFSLTLLIERGSLLLGTWQGIYFCEFDGPRRRNLVAKIVNG